MTSSTTSTQSLSISSSLSTNTKTTTTTTTINDSIYDESDGSAHTTTDISFAKSYSLQDYIPRATPPSSPTSCCDVLSIQDTVNIDEIPQSSSLLSLVINTNNNHNNPSLKQRKRVSFTPLVKVRTHTIVLGDHPMCSGGMALQLGWESSSTQYVPLLPSNVSTATNSWTNMIRSTTSQQSTTTTKRNLSQLRLNYQQRRQRLMELTGYTSAQLLHEEYLLVCCCRCDNNNNKSNFPTTRSAITTNGDV
jgi:hypothetical protein